MNNDDVLTAKEQALISVSASIAAGCQPCTAYHVNAAHSAGACDRSVTLAIETAVSVRESATRAMSDWARRCQSARPEVGASFRDQKRLVAALAAVAAAVAVNSVPDLKKQLEAARGAGASPEQIHAAVAIAGAIQRTAAQKVAEALAEDCCAEQPAEVARPAGCGCR